MSEVRLIDANAYAAEMKVRQDACKEIMDAAKEDDNWEMYDRMSAKFSIFVEAKLTLDAMPTVDAVPGAWWVMLKNSVTEAAEQNRGVEENRQWYDCACFVLSLMGAIERRVRNGID